MTKNEMKKTLKDAGISFTNTDNHAALSLLIVDMNNATADAIQHKGETPVIDNAPVITAGPIAGITEFELTTVINFENQFKTALGVAQGQLTQFYVDTLTTWELLKDNGLPTTSGKKLVKVFTDWPLNEDNKLLGIEIAKTTHRGAAFVKRAYMAIRFSQEAEKKASMTVEEVQEAKDKKASKPSNIVKAGASPEVLKKADVMAYLERNKALAYAFVIADIEKASADAALCALCCDATEVLTTFVDASNIVLAS
jgi:hypothetical protein